MWRLKQMGEEEESMNCKTCTYHFKCPFTDVYPEEDEIVIGGVYSNGKEGRLYIECEVIGICSGRVQYKVLKAGYSYLVNECGWMILPLFASWAKERIS